MTKILDFYSKNCAPCTQLKKELSSFENVDYIDVAEDFEKALQYNIRKAPTVVVLEDDVEVKRFSGFKSKEEIEEFLK